MLETRTSTASRRTRLAEIPLRAAPARPRSIGSAALRRQAEPVPRPAPAIRPNRLGRSEMRLMGLATACTVVVCGMLLLYLAAYAQVTRLGIAQAEARGQLSQNILRNEMLQAERNRLQSPQRVIAAAETLGMTTRGATPIEYISATSQLGKPLAAENNGIVGSATQGESADQRANGGTTADIRTAASFDH